MEEFVARVVTKLLVIVVEVTGAEMEAGGAIADPGDETWDDLGNSQSSSLSNRLLEPYPRLALDAGGAPVADAAEGIEDTPNEALLLDSASSVLS